jgi:hydrogenase maturation protein HypF
MAAAYLIDAGLPIASAAGLAPSSVISAVERMLDRGFNSPFTTSAGRLFDAVAALAGFRRRVSYEGQAAIELEWLASHAARDEVYDFEMQEPADCSRGSSPILLDMRPLAARVCEDMRRCEAPAVIARRFHSTIVDLIARVCNRLRVTSRLDAVVLSGGVFMNALLAAEVPDRLEADGFRVFSHRRVPPGDGGISLGQLAVAAARQNEI